MGKRFGAALSGLQRTARAIHLVHRVRKEASRPVTTCYTWPMGEVLDDRNERISSLAEQLRASGAIGRSELINRLFAFLLAQSLAGRSPKEVEVAYEVFGKDAQFDVAQDASVRVHIHRLRRKLEEIYAGTTGDRLTIPRGEYRLAVQDAPIAEASDEAVDPVEEVPVTEPAPRRIVRPSRWILLGLCLGLALGVALGAIVWGLRGRSTPIEVFEPVPDVAAEDVTTLTALMRRYDHGDRAALDDIASYAAARPDDAALACLVYRLRAVGPGGSFVLD